MNPNNNKKQPMGPRNTQPVHNHSQLQSHHIDYKNIELLKKFLNPHARMISRKRSGISSKHQRLVANAIKRARFLGLLPYVAK